ncbi:MAG TPA: glycoside hydrolase family 99-like domain-containing protein [Verrucomicrobiae bacterium]|nr:glycoside hydrolase family 99-like domain-containing protein [Verrucomicrobiae bacterium]
MAAFLGMAVAGHADTKTWGGEYVPAPEPVAGRITLGAYIFPGWYRDTGRGDYPYRTHDEDSEWKNCIAKQPAPRPLLGFYDDSLPEVNDWHIKWALEHGVSFFAFDWYWNAGEKRLSRSLEQGFLKAKYADRMKFCIHWCNHSLDWKRDGKPAPLDFGVRALTEMAEYLAGNYFKRPNYLTVEGRPVFISFLSDPLVAANGGPAGFRGAIGEMNKVLRAKGLKDLYFVALNGGPHSGAAGFSAFTAYAYYGTDMDSPYEWKSGFSIPYADMVTHCETMWQSATRKKDLPYIVPVDSNWDNRPRARGKAVVITGKTPDLFEKMCRASLRYIDKRNNLAIIEAWNEWGEGSYIEPDKEFGFEFLDRVRKVYTDAPDAHTDLLPSDAKVAGFSVLNAEEVAQAKALESQPYPPPPLSVRTTKIMTDVPLPQTDVLKKWEFDSGTAEGWRFHQIEPVNFENGRFVARVTSGDPQLIVQHLGVEVEAIGHIALRIKAARDCRVCEVFWTTKKAPSLSERKSFSFGLKGDGEWHTYLISKKPEGEWGGTLEALRLDIGSVDETFEIDWIRLYGKGNPQ